MLLIPLLLAAFSCGSPPPPSLPGPAPDPLPEADQVESVLFLLGDPGEARDDLSPLMVRLGADIEAWSGRLAPAGAVALIVLGDIVYPEGVRPRETEAFHGDTAIVMSQARLLAGPNALRIGAAGYFIAGNHDWGYRRDRADLGPLIRLEEVLAAAEGATGAAVRLVPAIGTGGPYTVDWGDRLRLVLLDTQWWLVASTRAERRRLLEGVEDAFAGAGEREVVIAAHHPFRSGGPHGGRRSFWRTVGVQYLLFRSGAILQDLTSAPYRELETGLRAIFARHRPPLLFAGGHEHSLQLIRSTEPLEPAFSVVSGSGSKLSPVGDTPGTLFAASAPGYIRVFVLRDGSVRLTVEATEPEYRLCSPPEPERSQCMAEGLAAFRTLFSTPVR